MSLNRKPMKPSRKAWIKRTWPKKGKKRSRVAKQANKGKLKSISKLIKEADSLFSKKVRQKDVDACASTVCYTCGFYAPWKKLHCGHFLSRYYKAARWHEDNARPQCVMCNLWKKGDTVRFRQNLIKEIGLDRVEAVEALRDQPTKLSREYLESLIAQLKG